MKNINLYILEKLILAKSNKQEKLYSDEFYYKVMDVMLTAIKSEYHGEEKLIQLIDTSFKGVSGLQDKCINYINNHEDFPELLDGDAAEIYSYFKELPEDEFKKYLKK